MRRYRQVSQMQCRAGPSVRLQEVQRNRKVFELLRPKTDLARNPFEIVSSPEPLWMLGCAVVLGGGLELLVMPFRGGAGGLAEQGCQPIRRQWLEGFRHFQRLLENVHAIDAGDDDGGRQAQRVSQT